MSMRLRSRGHDLGRVRLTASGKLQLRPTYAGLLVAGKAATSYGPTRALAWSGAAVVVLAAATVLRRRRT